MKRTASQATAPIVRWSPSSDRPCLTLQWLATHESGTLLSATRLISSRLARESIPAIGNRKQRGRRPKQKADAGMSKVTPFFGTGTIIEHWDVLQVVPERAANDNGMF